MTDDMLIAIGERNGKVVFTFPHATNEFICDAENARQIAEQIARSSYRAHYGRDWTEQRSAITEQLRTRLQARALIVVRTLMEQGKKPEYIARHLVDVILTEIA